MGEHYGVTENGFVRKRLDEILNDLHDSLSEGFGINTRHNPKSYLGVLVTNFADKIAELWEIAEESYNAKYPSTAEGQSLDNAAEFGGSIRETEERTFYPIYCTGIDGTAIPVGTRISSDTNPTVYLLTYGAGQITLSNCTECRIRTAGSLAPLNAYSITINGSVFRSNSSASATENEILSALSVLINASSGFSAECVNDATTGLYLSVASTTNQSMSIVLSNTLTTDSVTSIVDFGTEEFGNILLPENTVTRIVQGPAGLKSVTNTTSRISGRNRETDDELRVSYAKKIFIRSRTMLESITSAILANVQGVETVAAYQNDTNYYVMHRPPHSVEVVVSGNFDTKEIAKQILATKAAGIQTCHCCGLDKSNPFVSDDVDTTPFAGETYAIEEDVSDDYGNTVTVRFSRPVRLLCDIQVTYTLSDGPIAVNMVDLIESTIREAMGNLQPGDDVIPQKWLSDLYKNVSGIAYFDIKVSTDDLTSVNCITGIGYNILPVCDSVTIVDGSDT